MECFAGVGAVGALGAKEIFDYNRDNFLYDRKLRLRKELQLQKFRIAQASLWRDDVRDLISLTEYKMHAYLFVNVLMLGFTVVLYCQGQLPPITPDWLMTGTVLSITGAFMFLLLSIWMAMQAAVAAQSYETRLLTQLVRLPIPSWQEVEACRTYASEFEQLEPRQMFRVPFVTGRQEGLVQGPAAAAGAPGRARAELSEEGTEVDDNESVDSGEIPGSYGWSRSSMSSGPRPGAAPLPAHCDPWGLERRGDGIYELGCKHGHDVAKLRHIMLARHAMTYWQTYDAFARVSLSIGVNQLLLAMSYYIIGYVMVEAGCRTAATYGVTLLTVMAETLTRLDMSLSLSQTRLLQVLLLIGPMTSCFAGYHWTHNSEESSQTAETLIVLSFFSHSMYLALMTHFAQIRQQDNGAMLPTAFRSVLYLDVFGWLKLAQQGDAPDSSPRVGGDDLDPSMTSPRHHDAAPSYYADDYMVPGEDLSTPGRGSASNDVAENSAERPALGTVKYDTGGRPIPRRPEDMAARGAVQDMRGLPGAPQPKPLIGEMEETKFYSASSWLPGKQRSEEEVPAQSTLDSEQRPGILPWAIFTTVMRALCLAWVVVAIYHSLGASNVWDLDAPSASWLHIDSREPHKTAESSESPHLANMVLLNIGEGVLPRLHQEAVSVSWPFANLEPQSLACDGSGHYFVVSDGLTLYTGVLNTSVEMSPVRALRRTTNTSRTELTFQEILCPPLIGEGLQDVSVVCQHSAIAQPAACEAFVLHQHGRRVASCSLPEQGEMQHTMPSTGHKASISSDWLEQLRVGGARHGAPAEHDGPAHGRVEKIVAISFDAECEALARDSAAVLGNCTVAGTNYGRAVRLRRRSPEADMLDPAEALHSGSGAKRVPVRPGAMRALGAGGLSILQEDGRSIRVLPGGSGAPGGRFSPPPTRPARAFCIGGGQLYTLGNGPKPRLWRAPLPLQFTG